jgi:lipoate---protein ligase
LAGVNESTAGQTWSIQTESGPATTLHARSAALCAGPVSRTVRFLHAESPVLVLGSAQPASDADPAALARTGIGLARRRSGGGAVLVGPGLVAWVDLLLPAGDPLWEDDVGRAAWWVGDLWARSLEGVGLHGTVWKDALCATPHSSRMCFAGVGSGEVCVEGRKLVGVAQRRTKFAALFQTAVLIVWQPEATLQLLALSQPARTRAARDLRDAGVGLGEDLVMPLLDSFLISLPG